MNQQFANPHSEPQWAKGLNEDQKAAIRREALRQGKTPTELVKEWILNLSEKLCDQSIPKDAA